MRKLNFTAGCPIWIMNFRTAKAIAKLIITGWLISVAPAAGQEDQRPVEQAGEPAGDNAPSVELLEFLGEWETEEGRWIDPTQFDPTPFNDREMDKDTRDNDERPSQQ